MHDAAALQHHGVLGQRQCHLGMLQDQATLDRLIGLRLDDAGNSFTKPGGIPAR